VSRTPKGTRVVVSGDYTTECVNRVVTTTKETVEMDLNALLQGPRVAWSLPLGNYEMVCTIEERPDLSSVLVVKENGAELAREEFPAAPREDPASAMAVWDRAWKLREQFYPRASKRMSAEFERLRPRS